MTHRGGRPPPMGGGGRYVQSSPLHSPQQQQPYHLLPRHHYCPLPALNTTVRPGHQHHNNNVRLPSPRHPQHSFVGSPPPTMSQQPPSSMGQPQQPPFVYSTAAQQQQPTTIIYGSQRPPPVGFQPQMRPMMQQQPAQMIPVQQGPPVPAMTQVGISQQQVIIQSGQGNFGGTPNAVYAGGSSQQQPLSGMMQPQVQFNQQQQQPPQNQMASFPNNNSAQQPMSLSAPSGVTVQQHQTFLPTGNTESHQISPNHGNPGVTPSTSQDSSVASAGFPSSFQSLATKSGNTATASNAVSADVNLTESDRLLDRKKLEDLVREVDPMEQLDEDVKDALLHLTDDFVDSLLTDACRLAKHRHANTLAVEDVQMVLERNWDIFIPGVGNDEIKEQKKDIATEAHKQRMALIKKTLKKN